MIRISFVLNDGEYLNRLPDIVVEHRGRKKKETRIRKLHFHDRTLFCLTVYRVAFGHLYANGG